jgi:hypothetical protein
MQYCDTERTGKFILVRESTPYVDKIIGYHQCGFWSNWSTTYKIFCIHQILEKKLEFIGAVHQLFVDLKKAYDSIRREVFLLNLVYPCK